jgi:predicted DNA-binding transcriptional regulator AlpA
MEAKQTPRRFRAPAGRLTVAQTCERLGINRATLHRWRTKPERAPRGFPLPRQIAGRLSWGAREIDEWLAAQPRVRIAGPEAAA